MLLTCLPMLGDYFTSDMLSASPKTAMVGNLINDSVQAPGQTGQAGAFVMLVFLVALLPMLYYIRVTSRRDEVVVRERARSAWWNDPWRPPRFLVAITAGYLAWSLLPVLDRGGCISFNDGRSRTTWQGFSFRWYWGDPTLSVWHNAALHTALLQTLKLGVIATLITVPLGVLFAIGIDRWRGRLPDGRELPDAAVVRAARGAARRRAAVRDHHGRAADRPRHHRAGDRPGHLPGVLSRGAGAGPAGHHRPAIRRSRNGSRRVAAWRAAADHPADADARDLRQHRAGVRRRDRRLRAGALSVRRRRRPNRSR